MQLADQKTPGLPELTIVLPVRDEAAILRQVLDGIHAAFVDVPLEVIAMIDTRSTDGSAQILQEYAKEHARDHDPLAMRIIPLDSPGCGSGTARMIGSRESRGELIVWMDADGTYAPSDLRRLVESIGSEDQVVGARSRDFGPGARLRFAVKSAIARLAASLWHRPDLVDLNSGLRVFKRSALLEWLDELPAGFSCTTTATLAALNRRHAVRFSPVSYFPRTVGTRSKFHPFFDTARLLQVVWRQWRLKANHLAR